MNCSFFFHLASASQTLLSSESLTDELNDDLGASKMSSQSKTPLSPTHQLANKIRALTRSSEVRAEIFGGFQQRFLCSSSY